MLLDSVMLSRQIYYLSLSLSQSGRRVLWSHRKPTQIREPPRLVYNVVHLDALLIGLLCISVSLPPYLVSYLIPSLTTLLLVIQLFLPTTVFLSLSLSRQP